MRSPITRMFTLVLMIFGLAILCVGCVNSAGSRALSSSTAIKNKQVLATPTLSIRVNKHQAPPPSYRALVSRIAPAAYPQSTPVPSTPSHRTLRLLLACSGPTARDGFSVINNRARVCVYTTPGATLTIRVRYYNGKTDPNRILQNAVIADSNGFHEWDWVPIANCGGGIVWGCNVTVIAQLQGTSTSVSEAYTSSSSSISSSSSSSAASSP